MNKVLSNVRIGGMGALVVGLLTAIPEPYATYVRYILACIAGIGLVCTQIPAPDPNNKKLVKIYKLVNFLGANWGAALNYMFVVKNVHHVNIPTFNQPVIPQDDTSKKEEVK